MLCPVWMLRKAFGGLVLSVVCYALCLILLTYPPIQRFVLYSHKLHTARWVDINKPEQFGFAKNQITPFKFTAPGNEILYAWHIMPLGLYAKHEAEMLHEPSGLCPDITKAKAFKLLRDQPDSQLLISFHGNTGTVAQSWRTDTYRALADGSPSNIHIMAFDYRGFGHSSGFPTEDGVVVDGIAAVQWALDVARIPQERIVILGQSLGTYVASAVADHYAQQGIEFAGVILVAGFTDLPNLLLDYAIAGYIPVLSPLRWFPELQNFLTSYLIETWQTVKHVASLVRSSKRVQLFILHALDDREIPWFHSQELFAAAVNATTDGSMQLETFKKVKKKNTVDFGDGTFISTWKDGRDKIVREQIIGYGGHGRVMTYAPISLAVLKAFSLDDGLVFPEEEQPNMVLEE